MVVSGGDDNHGDDDKELCAISVQVLGLKFVLQFRSLSDSTIAIFLISRTSIDIFLKKKSKGKKMLGLHSGLPYNLW